MPGFDNGCLFFEGGIDPRGIDPIVLQPSNQAFDGSLLIGSTVAPFLACTTLTMPASGFTTTLGHNSIVFSLNDDLAALEGLLGFGVASRTALNTWVTSAIVEHSLLAGGPTSAITNLGPLTDGQILIGRTGNYPLPTTLSAGSGVTITNASGSITIASTSGGLTWTDSTNAAYGLSAQNGYITDRGGGVTYTLPATGSMGETIKIVGKTGLATIAQNANQQIMIGSTNTTAGVGGTLTATNAGDCLELICITAGANTVWRVDHMMGNWTPA